MKHAWRCTFCLLLWGGVSAVPRSGTGATSAARDLGAMPDNEKPTLQPCVIVKRMGPADQVTSHMYSFGIRGKQFQYIEGHLPESVKFHGRLTDHDVREIQDAGGKVEVLESHYTDEELQAARKRCGQDEPHPDDPKKTGAAAASAAAQPLAAQSAAPPPAASQPGAAPAATRREAEDLTTVVLKSTPAGADLTVDGKYMGSTPSTVRLAAGDHVIVVEKSGFKPWQRTIAVNPGGIVNVDATLEKNP